MATDWKKYAPQGFYDELVDDQGQPRPGAKHLAKVLGALSDRQIGSRQSAADKAIMEMGITFTVYSEGTNIDRSWPLDIIPRTVEHSHWETVSAGLEQRLKALNMFINDLYNDQTILDEKIVPRALIESSKDFLPQCKGMKPAHNTWANICGTDLVRDASGTMFVLEDNLRVPSGVSYMLENRAVMKRVYPELFAASDIATVDDYPHQLFDMLTALSPRPDDEPEIVVLTPGVYNSAYFEHAFLAQRMGAELVAGSDLRVLDDVVYMRNIDGLKRVDVIYRRIGDEFLDPKAFNKDSLLGVPGLFSAWIKGNVGLANAPGAGVADDKVIYSYVPDIIRYYLSEEPILPNVDTYRCSDPASLQYVLENLSELVVKPANESGGYGMLVGPAASQEEVNMFRSVVEKNPRNYIAQPTLALSTAPTVCDTQIEPRHLDLRPFILQAKDSYVTPGGLTRVAMRRGSLVVNSSQGGGSKDTWIVKEEK